MTLVSVLPGILAYFGVVTIMMVVIFLTIRRCARAIGHSTWSVIEAHYQSNWDLWFGNPDDSGSRLRAKIAETRWASNLLWQNILLGLIVFFGPAAFLLL